MKLQLLLIAASLSAASAGLPKRLFKKYAMAKVMESCFGEKLMSDMAKETMAASVKCLGEPAMDMPQAAHNHRTKRSDDGKTIHHKSGMARMKILSMMGNVTCVMKELKMLNADNEVDYDSIKQRIMSMPLPKELVDDLYQGMERCREFSSCLPGSNFEKSPLMARFGKRFAFFKCFKMAKIESCMKHDFRGGVFPMLMSSELGMHATESFPTIMASAMLEETADM